MCCRDTSIHVKTGSKPTNEEAQTLHHGKQDEILDEMDWLIVCHSSIWSGAVIARTTDVSQLARDTFGREKKPRYSVH